MDTFFQKIIDRDKTPKNKAPGELRKFFAIGLICLLLGIFVAYFLLIPAAGAGARSLVLSYHDGNKHTANLSKYRIGSVLLLALPFVALIAA